jgi:hypothetical protein
MCSRNEWKFIFVYVLFIFKLLLSGKYFSDVYEPYTFLMQEHATVMQHGEHNRGDAVRVFIGTVTASDARTTQRSRKSRANCVQYIHFWVETTTEI